MKAFFLTKKQITGGKFWKCPWNSTFYPELKSILPILFIMDFLLSRATPFRAAKSGSAAKCEVAKPRRQHAVLNKEM